MKIKFAILCSVAVKLLQTSQMDAPETDDSRGISLVGNQAGVSSSGAAVDLSFPTVEERGKKWELSAEEMNKRMSKHLENQVTEWSEA